LLLGQELPRGHVCGLSGILTKHRVEPLPDVEGDKKTANPCEIGG
jgi:hypothetical protein